MMARTVVELLGAGLRDRRVDIGLSLRALAENIQIDHAFVHRIERGEKIPSLVLLRRICRSLGVASAPFESLAEAAVVERWRRARHEEDAPSDE